MNPSHLLKGLRLNKIRNIIIYASFIILVISLLSPLQDVDNSYVQKASLIFFFYGLFLWSMEHFILVLSETVKKRDEWMLSLIWISLMIIGILMAFELALDVNLLEVFWNYWS